MKSAWGAVALMLGAFAVVAALAFLIQHNHDSHFRGQCQALSGHIQRINNVNVCFSKRDHVLFVDGS